MEATWAAIKIDGTPQRTWIPHKRIQTHDICMYTNVCMQKIYIDILYHIYICVYIYSFVYLCACVYICVYRCWAGIKPDGIVVGRIQAFSDGPLVWASTF